ncbi:phospholipid scramblase-related protein [soil metagenome]
MRAVTDLPDPPTAAGAGAAADWYPDPAGRHELRYFDGSQWTEHVSSHGRQSVDPIQGPGKVPTVNVDPTKIQRQVQKKAKIGPDVGPGGGTIFTEPVLVVNQKAKLIELNNEYAVFDQNGRQLGAVRQVGQSKLKKAARLLSSVDQFMTHKLQVCDPEGVPLLALTRPAKFVKSRVIVQDGAGHEVGQIVQQNMIGKIRFSLESGGHTYGSINGENWRAWNFNIQDQAGTEIARITKTFEGVAKTMFTTADNYVVQIHRPLDEPLRSLVVASALSVDTALKQDARGLG